MAPDDGEKTSLLAAQPAAARRSQERLRSGADNASHSSDRIISMVIRDDPTPEVDDAPSGVRWRFQYLLVIVVVGMLAYAQEWSAYMVFTLNLLGLLPLGVVLSRLTESLALSSSTLGVLVHAVLRNSVELIIGISVILAGEYTVLKAFVLGSIVSNQLVVAGMHIWALALRGQELVGESESPLLDKSSLVLVWIVVASVVLPSGVAASGASLHSTMVLSRASALLFLLFYVCILVSEWKTINEGGDGGIEPPSSKSRASHEERYTSDELFLGGGGGGGGHPDEDNEAMGFDDEDDDLERARGGGRGGAGAPAAETKGASQLAAPPMDARLSVVLLLVALTATVFSCRAVAQTISRVSLSIGVSPVFLGFAAIPFVGNLPEILNVGISAAESRHSISNSIGSSILVGLFVLPMVTLVAWATGQTLTLRMPLTDCIVLVQSAVVVAYTLGMSNAYSWVVGAGLLLNYAFAVLAMLFALHYY